MNNIKSQSQIKDTNEHPYLNPRQIWLLENLVPQTIERLKTREKIIQKPVDVLTAFAQADPSANKSATQWLLQSYLREGFLWEDLQGGQTSKASETLILFDRFKQHLSAEKRSLYAYSTLGDLYASVRVWIENVKDHKDHRVELTGMDLKREQQQQARAQSKTLWDQADLKIVVPLTKFASQWWGQGTRWCTASEKYSYFDQYNEKAPLLVILFKDLSNTNRKLQFWSHNTKEYSSLQWMDEMDNSVTKEFVQAHWLILKPAICALLDQFPPLVFFMPETLRTQQMYTRAIQVDPHHFIRVPQNLLNEQMCIAAITRETINLQAVPEPLRSHQVCLIAVEKNNHALKYVPKHVFSTAIFERAVKRNSHALVFLSLEQITREICAIACQANALNIEIVPKAMLDQKLCDQAVEKQFLTINMIPPEFKHIKMIEKAVVKNPTVLGLLNERDRTRKICWLAVKKSGTALKWVPQPFKTRQLCELAVQQAGLALEWVPENLITEKLCAIAIDNTKDLKLTVNHIPEKFRTQEIWQQILQKNGGLLESIKPQEREYNLCLIAVKQSANAIRFVPQENQTPEIVLAALSKNISLHPFVDQKQLTDDIYLQAVKNTNDWYNLLYITQTNRDNTILEIVLKKNIKLFKHVPKALIKGLVAERIVQKDPKNIEYVLPENLTNSICLQAARSWKHALNWIPQTMKTPEILDAHDVLKKQIELNEKKNDKISSTEWKLNEFVQIFENYKKEQDDLNNEQNCTFKP